LQQINVNAKLNIIMLGKKRVLRFIIFLLSLDQAQSFV
jgi:hypothetical protein